MAPRTRSQTNLEDSPEELKQFSRGRESSDDRRTSPPPISSNTNDDPPAAVWRTQMFSILSCSFLISSFALLMPFYQSRRDALDCDVQCYGRYTSLRSALSLLGSVLCGRASDVLGRRSILLVGVSASLIGLFLSAQVTTISGLYWAMVPGALFQNNFSVTKALYSDVCNEHDLGNTSRASMVGKLGMSVGLSFMVGPLVSSYITDFNTSLYIATFLVVLSGISVLFIPSPPPAASRTEPKPFLSSSVLKSLRSPPALTLMVIRILMGLAFHVFMTIWTPSLKRRFDFGPKDHGRFMSFIGLSYAASQGFIAKRVVSFSRGDSTTVLVVCSLFLGCGRLVAYRASSLYTVYATFFFIISSLGTSNTVLTEAATRVSDEDAGGVFGALTAVEAAAGMFGPVLGGYLAGLGEEVPIGFVVLIYLLCAFWVKARFESHFGRLAPKKKEE